MAALGDAMAADPTTTSLIRIAASQGSNTA